jgi:hypothetical protein
MSTATLPNIKDLTINRLNSNVEQYIKDMSFIPDDKLSVVPMGCARPVLEFTAEVIGFNMFVAKAMRGEPIPNMSDEDKAAFFATVNCRAVAEKMLTEGVSEIITAFERLSDAELMEEVTLYWGQTESRLIVANMAASHMGYHDGQLNYIQALFGDGANHWGE